VEWVAVSPADTLFLSIVITWRMVQQDAKGALALGAEEARLETTTSLAVRTWKTSQDGETREWSES